MPAFAKQVSHEATSENTCHATGSFPRAALVKQQLVRNLQHLGTMRLLGLPAVLVMGLAFCPGAKAESPEFASIPGLNFTTTYGLDNPLSQMITVASTGTNFAFTATASTNGGGDWLAINPSNYGCCGLGTPYGVTVIATPAVTLAAGTYTGQIVMQASGVIPMTVPVTLVVHPTTDTYFDQIAGGLTFSMATSGLNPPGQQVQVRNAGAGTLAWTASTSTADGGNWLSVMSASGSAPSNLTVSVTSSNLPGTGLTAGTFIGQVVFTSASDTVTVPVTINVGTNVVAQVNPLNFVKTFGGANPLSQKITIATTGTTSLAIYGSVQNSTGGSWLQISPNNYGCCGLGTPQNITVSVNPGITLAAGTYMAEVIINAASGSQNLSIPVTLTINPPTNAYLDNVAGALDFSMAIGGNAPPAQNIQIRNAGTGALNWTAVTSTADGGNWLSISQTSGAAPDDVTVSVNPANVPGQGLVAETLIGQVSLQSPTGDITIPVTFPVSGATFRQVNPLSFTKVFGGANPLSQMITIASTGTNFAFYGSTISATGGNWLSITPSNYGCCGVSTPYGITVSVNPAITLAVGTYSAEVLVTSGSQALMIPVTLTIEPATATFFDATPGQLSFYMATGGAAPPAQVLPIRDAGVGTLDWTAQVSTSDGGDWLSISAEDGTAPSEPTVTVNPVNVPGGGLLAGTFNGTVLLQQNGQQISVPVSFIIGANVFYQMNPLSFTMTQGGGNPLPQVVTLASTGTQFALVATVANATGGSWLNINPSNYGCCGVDTPNNIQVSVTAPVTLAAGTYSSEIIVNAAGGSLNAIIPVTLYVQPPTTAYFEQLPGEVAFSMVTGGSAPPSQPLQIRNAGTGTLEWSATVTTADGNNWLSISAPSGAAPSVPQVSVNPSKLPGLGLIAGTFVGQVILTAADDQVTVPVVYSVGASVFRQVNGLNFNKTFGGPNPLPQLINLSSTGSSAVVFVGTAVSSTGGNWLSISPSNDGCCGLGTPQQMVVTANPAVTLAAGTYSAEILFSANSGAISMVVPVTLTVNAPTATYFDDVPGAVTFFQATGGTAPPAQSFAIRNSGTGTLDWTATATTSDGGNWLSVSPGSGTAPDSVTVSVTPTNLPGESLTAGQFNGQIVLTAGIDIQTIPVEMVVGANVFEPVKPLTFTKNYGGSNPGLQPISLLSTGSNFGFYGQADSATGGSWLAINPSCCGISTPTAIDALVDPVPNLAPGSYLGETIFTTGAGDQGIVVPVTLTVLSVPAMTPSISLGSGTYTGVQTVSIADSTPGSTIYYSLNGKAPTSASTKYTGPIKVSEDEKLEAIAYAPGYLPSAVPSSTYTIMVNTPSFSIKSGTYAKTFTFTMADAWHGSTIHYTVNGGPPTAASTKYTGGPLTVSSNETIRAIAVAPDTRQSVMAMAAYDIETAKPVITPAGGNIAIGKTVTITDSTKSAKIYYTTNNDTPTAASKPYLGPIKIVTSETIKAIAIAPQHVASTVTTEHFTAK